MAALSLPVGATHAGELRLLPDLMSFLKRTRRIGKGTSVAHEVPWRGRRVDLATLTNSGVLSAYELKLGKFGRVLEQAIYNTHAFDRSWVVIDRMPRPEQIEIAADHGVGIIVVSDDRAKVVLRAGLRRADRSVRIRLLERISLSRGGN